MRDCRDGILIHNMQQRCVGGEEDTQVLRLEEAKMLDGGIRAEDKLIGLQLHRRSTQGTLMSYGEGWVQASVAAVTQSL